MTSLIFRFAAPYLTSLMLLFSVFVTLRGHNEPGGGFIGGLIAASALSIHALAFGGKALRRAIVADPIAIAASGLVLAVLAGVVSIPAGTGFMTGLWWFPFFLDEVGISTPLFFDLGVYLVVLGAITAIVLAIADGNGERP